MTPNRILSLSLRRLGSSNALLACFPQLPPGGFLEIHLASFLGRGKPLTLAENFFIEKRPKRRANVLQPNLEIHTLTS